MENVLIVEDEMIIALTLEQMVHNMGHQVVAKVTSGEHAVERSAQLKPDIILMDIRLKGKIDGIEAIQKIHSSISIPVIYITGNNDPVYRERIQGTDYLDFIIKPVSQPQLMKSFRKAS